MSRRANTAARNLIKRWEGLKLEAYLCPANVWTIGWGTTQGVRPGMRITEAEAERLFDRDLAKFEDAVAKAITVPLTDNQFGALVSWTYNVGIGAMQRSTLRRMLNAGDYASVPTQLARWNKAGGRELLGLTRRRADEADLWRTPDRAAPVARPAPAAPPAPRSWWQRFLDLFRA